MIQFDPQSLRGDLRDLFGCPHCGCAWQSCLAWFSVDKRVDEHEFVSTWTARGLGDVWNAITLFNNLDTDKNGAITEDPDVIRVQGYMDRDGKCTKYAVVLLVSLLLTGPVSALKEPRNHAVAVNPRQPLLASSPSVCVKACPQPADGRGPPLDAAWFPATIIQGTVV